MKKLNKLAREIVRGIYGERASRGGNQMDDWIDDRTIEWIAKLEDLIHDHESKTKKSS